MEKGDRHVDVLSKPLRCPEELDQFNLTYLLPESLKSANHGLTGIATGRFSIKDNSIAAYSPPIQLAIALIMVMGAISFPIHYQLLQQRRWSALWRSAQHRALWLLLGGGTIVLLLENRWFSGSLLWIDSLFQWTSALTTCGFSTVKLQEWSGGAKLILTAAMLMGGAAGSTVGGLKLNRVVALWQGIRWRFKGLLPFSNSEMHYHLYGKELTKEDAHRRIQSAAVLTVVWLLLIMIGLFVLSHLVSSDYTMSDVLFEVASATSNVGLSTGISDPSLHWGGKLMLILLMWMGRIEIIPVLLLALTIFGYLRTSLSTHKADR